MRLGKGSSFPEVLSGESDVQLPISVQRSLLDFLFTQEEVQCGGNNVGVLAKLFRQVAFADDYVPGWVALVDTAPVDRNFVSESAQFFLPITLHTLGSALIGLQTPSGRNCDSDSGTSDHCAGPPV